MSMLLKVWLINICWYQFFRGFCERHNLEDWCINLWSMPLPVQIVIMVFFYSGIFEQSVLQFNLQKIDAQQVMMSFNCRIILWDFSLFIFIFRKAESKESPHSPFIVENFIEYSIIFSICFVAAYFVADALYRFHP